jgi:hypothetical protein
MPDAAIDDGNGGAEEDYFRQGKMPEVRGYERRAQSIDIAPEIKDWIAV